MANIHCKVIEDNIDLNLIIGKMVMKSTGAVVIFTGIVREVTLDGQHPETLSLEYEAYLPMAEMKMDQIAEEITVKWPMIEAVEIIQRVGHFEPGTPTVVVACSAAHRDSGIFEAAKYGIDRLKEIVPIWKKELGPYGDTWIEGDYHPSVKD